MAAKVGHLSPLEENLRHLRSFQEAVNIDDCHLHTKYLLNILFDRMIHVVKYYSDDAVDRSATEGGTSWEGYGARKADNGDDAIRDAQKDRQPECVAALRMMKRTANQHNQAVECNAISFSVISDGQLLSIQVSCHCLFGDYKFGV